MWAEWRGVVLRLEVQGAKDVYTGPSVEASQTQPLDISGLDFREDFLILIDASGLYICALSGTLVPFGFCLVM
jgi:hypothetical protein